MLVRLSNIARGSRLNKHKGGTGGGLPPQRKGAREFLQ